MDEGCDGAAGPPRARSTGAPGTRVRRRIVGCSLAAAVLAGGVAAALVTLRPPAHRASGPSRAAAPRVVAEDVPQPIRTPSPTVASVPHDAVPAAVPTAFTLTGPAFTIRAEVCAMPAVFPLDPPGDQHHRVCWVRGDFGVAPGSDTGTSYVLGHSWAPDPQEVLNRLSSPATREILTTATVLRDGIPIHPVHSVDGYHLILRTASGTLTYTVRDAFGVAKDQLGSMPSVLDPKVRHRVVLITCAERHGVDYDYNVVLEAYLSSSRRAPHAGAPG